MPTVVARSPRKLAVILHADVVDSTGLVRINESLAHERIQHTFRRFSETISRYGGTPHELRGDALVAEFDRASDAVAAALAFQAGNRQFNDTIDDEIRPLLRVGIALGEVVVADHTVTGEGVVLAQRLEQLAEPGSICIQGAVHEAIPGRLPFEYVFLGERTLKGIAEPVRAYAVQQASGTALLEPEQGIQSRSLNLVRVAGVALVLVLVVGFVLAWFYTTQDQTVQPVADKPSVAVLPFVNMSGDPEQEYFTDGMTSDLITDLSKVGNLLVIARNSVFVYKNQPVDAQQVSRELGVRYVIEGNVRRAGDRIRINVQLIDATTRANIWADRYDRDYQDIFALQSEVTRQIVSALAVELSATEQTELARVPTRDLQAYDHFLRAESGLYSQDSEGLRDALSFYRQATDLDPVFARAWAGDARAAADVWRLDWFDVMQGQQARRRAYESAGRALELNPNSARAYSVLAILQMVQGRHNDALSSAQKAVSLSPNDADAHLNLALVLSYSGNPTDAIAAVRTTLRLNPLPPAGVYRVAGLIFFMDRQYQHALELLRLARDAGDEIPHEELAMTYAQLGRIDEAKAELAGVLQAWPAANLNYYRILHAHYKRDTDLELRIEALRKAGLPEWPFDFQVPVSQRLKPAQVAEVLFDKIWIGTRVGGERFTRWNTDEGLVMYRDAKAHGGRSRSAFTVHGNASVSEDRLCYQYEQFLLAREYCGYVYRNPEGSAWTNDEFIDVNAIAVDYFSTRVPGS